MLGAGGAASRRLLDRTEFSGGGLATRALQELTGEMTSDRCTRRSRRATSPRSACSGSAGSSASARTRTTSKSCSSSYTTPCHGRDHVDETGPNEELNHAVLDEMNATTVSLEAGTSSARHYIELLQQAGPRCRVEAWACEVSVRNTWSRRLADGADSRPRYFHGKRAEVDRSESLTEHRSPTFGYEL